MATTFVRSPRPRRSVDAKEDKRALVGEPASRIAEEERFDSLADEISTLAYD